MNNQAICQGLGFADEPFDVKTLSSSISFENALAFK